VNAFANPEAKKENSRAGANGSSRGKTALRNDNAVSYSVAGCFVFFKIFAY
jgi:hypothetical protein